MTRKEEIVARIKELHEHIDKCISSRAGEPDGYNLSLDTNWAYAEIDSLEEELKKLESSENVQMSQPEKSEKINVLQPASFISRKEEIVARIKELYKYIAECRDYRSGDVDSWNFEMDTKDAQAEILKLERELKELEASENVQTSQPEKSEKINVPQPAPVDLPLEITVAQHEDGAEANGGKREEGKETPKMEKINDATKPAYEHMKPSQFVKFWGDNTPGIFDFPFNPFVAVVISVSVWSVVFGFWNMISSEGCPSWWLISLCLLILVLCVCIAYLCIRFLRCAVSYPFRCLRIKRFIKEKGPCFIFEANDCGTILGVSVCKQGHHHGGIHDWVLLAGKCTGQCTRCGILRDESHDWDGCKCKRCGQTRDEFHGWDGCKCKRCGRTRDESHDWDGCVCKRCGITRHDLNECVCKRCGITKHDWEYIPMQTVFGSAGYSHENYYDPNITSYFICRTCGAIRE